MIRKIKYIILIIIVVLVGILILISRHFQQENIDIINNNSNTDMDYYTYDGNGNFTDIYIERQFGEIGLTNEERNQMKYYDDHEYEMLLKMAQGGESWRCFPVLKTIKDSYDEEKGILSEYNFDNVEYSQETIDDLAEYGSVSPISFVGTRGKEKIKVYYYVGRDGGLVRLEKWKDEYLTDKEGNKLDNRMKCNKNNFEDIIITMMNTGYNLNSVAVTTESFKHKYEDLTDIFYQTFKPIGRYHTVMYYTNINPDNLTVDFYWEVENIEKLYRAHFLTDDNECIYDVNIEMLE